MLLLFVLERELCRYNRLENLMTLLIESGDAVQLLGVERTLHFFLLFIETRIIKLLCCNSLILELIFLLVTIK